MLRVPTPADASRKSTAMEVQRKSENIVESAVVKSTVKRPFDVAFLMLPDEKLKQKKLPKKEIQEVYSEEDVEIEIEDSPPREYKQKYPASTTLRQQIFDDPNITIKTKQPKTTISNDQRSAFTKVNLNTTANTTTRLSPLSSTSDLSYQNSLSPSPPTVNTRSYLLSQGQIFKNHHQNYHNHHQFLPENFQPENFFKSQPELHHHHHHVHQQQAFKTRPIYRPDLTYNYTYPASEVLKMSQPEVKFPQDIRTTPAAILTSLLPPSLAALSLPAQNVCAKCNVSFRMTSDLVYHMRSHHKNEACDVNKRRREEKLKCPVCQESFRERHHLTRHMTAHQDKDDDEKEEKKFN